MTTQIDNLNAQIDALDSLDATIASDNEKLEAARDKADEFDRLHPHGADYNIQSETDTEEESEKSDDKSEEDTESETTTPEDELKKRVALQHIEARKAKQHARSLERELAILRGQIVETPDEQYQREVQRAGYEHAKVLSYVDKANKIADVAHKEYKDFANVLDEYRQTFPSDRGVPEVLVKATMDVAPGDEHRVLYYLGKNLDEAEYLMTVSDAKRGSAIEKILAKLNKPPEVSKAPAPVKTVATKSIKSTTSLKDAPMDQFMKMRNDSDKNRRSFY